MDRRVQLICAWCGPAFLVLFLVGFWFVGGLVPPPSPHDGPEQIAAFYRENAGQLRAGTLIAMVGTALLIPFVVLVTLQIKRAAPALAPLAYVQLACGLALVLFVLLPLILIAVAAYRPDRDPSSTQLLNDTAFVTLFWLFATPAIEYLAMGLVALLDRSEHPLFPRWVGWFDLFVAAVFATGAPVTFVKGGPFAWDGGVAFWLVLIVFAAWIWVTFFCVLRAIDRPEMLPAGSRTG